MNILVTGGAGFIASHIVDKYIELGHTVTVIDNLDRGQQRNVNAEAKFIEMDIQSPELEKVFSEGNFELVNHHAAQVSVVYSLDDPIWDAKVNIIGTLNLLSCCCAFGIKKFIYANSGGASCGEPQYMPLDEKHPVDPLAPYGASKHTIEHYLYMYGKNNSLKYISLRYMNVYGPRQDPFGEGGVVAIFTNKMFQGEVPTINGDGEQTRDFVYVKDVVAANVAALDKGEGEGVLIGSGVETSVNDIYFTLKSLTNYPGEVVIGPAIAGEVRKIYANCDRAYEVLGWKPETNLALGLKETVAFYQSFSTSNS